MSVLDAVQRRGPWKPWYLWRPEQLAIRCWRSCQPTPSGYQPITTAWGGTIIADAATTIGRSLWTTAVHDLAVSETLVRLIDAGSLVIDAGAHVGYMTMLAAVAAGPGGTVLACEPHPRLFAMLQRNVDLAAGDPTAARVVTRNVALGAVRGSGTLVVPPEFDRNDGLARVSQDVGGGSAIAVDIEIIDSILGDATAAVLKLDVEGHELQALRGAADALSAGRIHHVIFEDFAPRASEVRTVLESSGYTVFSIGWSIRGLCLQPASRGALAKTYEAPSCLATLHPEDVLARCSVPGWQVLRKHLGVKH